MIGFQESRILNNAPTVNDMIGRLRGRKYERRILTK